MKRVLLFVFTSVGLCIVSGNVNGRGYGGGGRGGSYEGHTAGGGSYSGSYSHSSNESWGHGYGSTSGSYSGETGRGGSYSGSRSTESSSGYGGRSASGTYDHTWSDAAGGSVSTSGSRSASEGRYGNTSASSSRDTSVTTASGQTYSGNREGSYSGNRYTGAASGSREGSVSGPGGTASWNSAYSGNRYTGNMDHYASVYGANGAHSTAYWSSGNMATTGNSVRSGFGYYNAFQPSYYSAHPGAWAAAGASASSAWAAPAYSSVASYCGMSAAASPDYDYGSSVVFQGDNVYMNGQDAGTTQQYADQATTIASQGQTASAPPTDEWKPLGVFALVQGDDKTSNYIFQLAVNKDGIIRGNYYDGVMDTNTDVYGSVDKKTQRAAWTIGKKKDRVFEAGIYNLTQPECTCLLHVGTESTSQMMLVRMQQPKNSSAPAAQ
jgi:hypothetical protein